MNIVLFFAIITQVIYKMQSYNKIIGQIYIIYCLNTTHSRRAERDALWKETSLLNNEYIHVGGNCYYGKEQISRQLSGYRYQTNN